MVETCQFTTECKSNKFWFFSQSYGTAKNQNNR